MKVSIVIPNWNGQEKLARHLPSVLAVQGVDEIIIVDDASTDKSVQIIKTQFPNVKLIEKKTNTRFSDTVNIGVNKATGNLVFILNNDTSPKKDSLVTTLSHFENPQVFSVSCNVGGAWSWAKWKDGFFWHYMSPDQSGSSHQTLWASGGSGIFRKSIWEELGGFDTIYAPFYEEDVDLGYRATKRGYINIFEPKSIVEHYQETGVNETHFGKKYISKVAERNQLLFIWKNITSDRLFSEHKKQLVKMLFTHPKYWLTFLPALVKLGEIKTKRQLEKQQAKLTDEEILM